MKRQYLLIERQETKYHRLNRTYYKFRDGRYYKCLCFVSRYCSDRGDPGWRWCKTANTSEIDDLSESAADTRIRRVKTYIIEYVSNKAFNEVIENNFVDII